MCVCVDSLPSCCFSVAKRRQFLFFLCFLLPLSTHSLPADFIVSSSRASDHSLAQPHTTSLIDLKGSHSTLEQSTQGHLLPLLGLCSLNTVNFTMDPFNNGDEDAEEAHLMMLTRQLVEPSPLQPSHHDHLASTTASASTTTTVSAPAATGNTTQSSSLASVTTSANTSISSNASSGSVSGTHFCGANLSSC